MKYRADIDGLRAVAVIAVIFFHAGIFRMSGGFVGVDVFFVISGYLITGLILSDVAKNRFSISSFYERRVRRILPALFTILLATTLLGSALLMPDAERELGKSLVATLLFSSNILFWTQSGYFDAPAEAKPLLHTWSLAVEEQFYIAYPLLLFIVGKYLRKRYTLVLVIIGTLSLALSIWAANAHRSAAFFLAPTRAWELLLGGVLAIPAIPPLKNRLAANILGGTGVVLLLWSFVHLSGSMPFPGFNALYPTIGAALLIYSGTACNTIVARYLKLRPLVFIGLISYSLYLWHWIVLFFFRYYFARSLRFGETAVAIVLSVLLASLTWKFVENPFRIQPRLIPSRHKLFATAAVVSVALLMVGSGLYATNGLPHRFSPQVLELMSGETDYWARRDDCWHRMCRIGDANATPSFLLWGDSHAMALAPLFESLALQNKEAGFVAGDKACAPVLGLSRYDRDDPQDCSRFNASVLAFITANHIQHVFLHARWALDVEGTRYKGETGDPAFLTADRRIDENYPAFESLFRSTAEQLSRLHVDVTIIASVPEVGMDVPSVLARDASRNLTMPVATPYSDFTQRQARTFGILAQVAHSYGMKVVYPHQLLCSGSSCPLTDGNHPLYCDGNHLSVHGAMLLVSGFAPLLQESALQGSGREAAQARTVSRRLISP